LGFEVGNRENLWGNLLVVACEELELVALCGRVAEGLDVLEENPGSSGEENRGERSEENRVGQGPVREKLGGFGREILRKIRNFLWSGREKF